MKGDLLILNLAFALAVSTCGGNSEHRSPLTTMSIKKADDFCLLEFVAEDKGKFFTEDLIRPLANGNEIKSDHHETLHYYRYYWKEEGVIHFIGFEDMKTTGDLRLVRNELNKDVPNLMVDYVQSTYRDKTTEEANRLNKLLGEQIEKSDRPDAKAVSNEILQGKVMGMEQQAYIPLETVADYAVYNRRSFGLYLVVGEVFVTLSAQVGPYGSVDEPKSIDLAKRLTDKIASLCK